MPELTDLYYLLLVPFILGIMPALDIPTGKTYKESLKEMLKFRIKDKDE